MEETERVIVSLLRRDGATPRMSRVTRGAAPARVAAPGSTLIQGPGLPTADSLGLDP